MLEHPVVVIGERHPNYHSGDRVLFRGSFIENLRQVCPTAEIKIPYSSIDAVGHLKGRDQSLTELFVYVVKNGGH